MSVKMSVSETARALGVTERTIWRRIRAGRLETELEGRRLYVRMPNEYPLVEEVRDASRRPRAAEAVAPYASDPFVPVVESEYQVGPWPYTAEKIAERRRVFLAEQKAVFEEMDRFHSELKPWPPGYDFQAFIRELKDENRAWDALVDYERRMKARARRRRH
jgi:hypothetical protein